MQLASQVRVDYFWKYPSGHVVMQVLLNAYMAGSEVQFVDIQLIVVGSASVAPGHIYKQ